MRFKKIYVIMAAAIILMFTGCAKNNNEATIPPEDPISQVQPEEEKEPVVNGVKLIEEKPLNENQSQESENAVSNSELEATIQRLADLVEE